jgi:threonine 3-dehydrogenase
MKILLTGAGGQLGPEVASALRAAGHQVTATDVRAACNDASLPVQPLDVTSRDDVFRAIETNRPESVFHLAAILSAGGEEAPQRAYEVNQTGTYNLLEACRHFEVRQLIFTSSIAVFGPGLPDPTPDDVPLWPTTMYGVNKVSGELLGNYYRQRHGLDFRAVRFPGIISASMPGQGSSDYALYMYVDGVRKGHYTAFCRADTRIPLMYMPDAVRSLVELARVPRERLQRCVYNVAAFSPSAQEIAASITRVMPQVAIDFAPDPLRQGILDSWPARLDDGAARRDWGWQPRYDLEQMTADLIPRIQEMLERRERHRP